jgi:hypothetical protein
MGGGEKIPNASLWNYYTFSTTTAPPIAYSNGSLPVDRYRPPATRRTVPLI